MASPVSATTVSATTVSATTVPWPLLPQPPLQLGHSPRRVAVWAKVIKHGGTLAGPEKDILALDIMGGRMQRAGREAKRKK